MVSDVKLIKRIRRHNKAAADELFERYYRQIYAYVYRQTAEREIAFDITQDIFLTVFTALGTFDYRLASFRTWLYRIAANKITDYYRSHAHRIASTEIPLETVYDAATDEQDIETLLENRDYIRRIMESVSGFPPSWAGIFQMKVFEGMTFADISRLLHISENTAKARYYTIIKRLRKEYPDAGN